MTLSMGIGGIQKAIDSKFYSDHDIRVISYLSDIVSGKNKLTDKKINK